MKECSKCLHCYEDTQHKCPLDDTPLLASMTINLVINDRYVLERRLGKGGMGIVFKAKHKFLKSSHAIKVILPDLVEDDEALLIRFKQEAVLAASINHPNVIRVTDFGVEDGIMPYLVMEFIDGPPLSAFLVEGKKIPVERVLEYFKPVALGVGEAHKHGIVHRDLKPQNIMVQNGLPMKKAIKVLDFGLAKIKSTETMGSLVQARTLNVMGSPTYMSPEQWENENVDHRTDIYALGVLLYQMLTGKLPFHGDSIPSVMYQHLTSEPPTFESVGVAEISPAIEKVVKKSLEKESDDRYDKIEEMLFDFENAVGNPASQSYPNVETEVLPGELSSFLEKDTSQLSQTTSETDSESLSGTQKKRLSDFLDSSEQNKALADAQLAQEFLQAKDRVEEAEEKVSEADKLVNEFAEAQQFAQDAQKRALEAKKKIEEDVRRRVEAEMGNKIALEKQAQQKAEAERLAKESEARSKAEEEARRLAQVALEAQKQAEAARKKAEEEIHQREVHEDVRVQAENAALILAEEVAEAKRKHKEAQQRAAYEAGLRSAADEKRQRIENELQAIAEHEAERRKQAEAEVQKLIQEQASRYEQEAQAAQQTIEDAKRLAELEAQKRAEAEFAKKSAEEEARRLAEEIGKVKAHMEEIKQHSSIPPENNTVSFEDIHGASQTPEEDFSSSQPVSDPMGNQPTVDSFSINLQDDEDQTIDQPTVSSNQNILQTTVEVERPPDSDENISNLINTTPIAEPKFPAVKIILSVFGLLLVLIVGSVTVYFIAFRDDGMTSEKKGKTGSELSKKDEEGIDKTPDMSKSKNKQRVLVEGGSFRMGTNDVSPTDPFFGNQFPAHTVQVDSFLMDKTEVTNAEYAEFIKDKNHPAPSHWGGDVPDAAKENQPVTFVNLDDAKAYAVWVSTLIGKQCQIPTEEQWEYAARNGAQETLYPWGDDWEPEFSNTGTRKIKEVGSSKDITLKSGIQDMLGNVIEWTSSKHDLYSGHPATEKTNLEEYVIRGSSWGEYSDNLKKPEVLLTKRQPVKNELSSAYLGFRLVCQP